MKALVMLLIFIAIFPYKTIGQQAKNTVVFKVRKPIQNKMVTAEEKPEIVVEENKLFVVVEENATFQRGDLETFRAWVLQHLKYPEEPAEKGIEGKVILSFVVNTKGIVESVIVLRKVDPLLDQEAIRVIKSSPKWMPGRVGGKNVSQQFTIPVSFKLQP